MSALGPYIVERTDPLTGEEYVTWASLVSADAVPD